MIEFHVSQELPHKVALVKLSGELTGEAADYFLDCMQGVIEGGHRRVVVDCHRLRYISSLGLATLLRAHARLKTVGGDVKLAEVPSMIASMLSLMRLDRVFDVYPTVLDAQAAFGPDAPAESVPTEQKSP